MRAVHSGWIRLADAARIAAAAAGLALGPALSAAATPPTPDGAQLQVNTHTTGAQQASAVSAQDDGGFVVVWESYGSAGDDGDATSIQARRYSSDGSPQGGEFQVNTYTTSYQLSAAVAAVGDGRFVVVWDSYGSSGSDGDATSIQARRYSSDGSPQGGGFQVNSYTTSSQFQPAVAAEPGGDFVVVWTSSGGPPGEDASGLSVRGQRFSSDGSPQGGEFQVNTYTTGDQVAGGVAAEADGSFVVVWESQGSSGSDASGSSIQARRFSSSGTAQGSDFQVNTYTTSHQIEPSVAADPIFGFVVSWESYESTGLPPTEYRIRAQRFDSGGSPLGSEMLVTSLPAASSEHAPSVAAAADGTFAIVRDTSSGEIVADRFDSSGTPIGSHFQVNAYTTGTQIRARAAMVDDGRFVVVWDSYGSPGDDTSSFSVQGQRYLPEPGSAAIALGAGLAAALARGRRRAR